MQYIKVKIPPPDFSGEVFLSILYKSSDYQPKNKIYRLFFSVNETILHKSDLGCRKS